MSSFASSSRSFLRPSSLPATRIPYVNHTPLPTPSHDSSTPGPGLLSSPQIRMSFDLLPTPISPTHGRVFRRWRSFFRSNGLLGTAIFIGAFVFASLIVYTTFLSPSGPPWHRPSDLYGLPVGADESLLIATKHASPSTPTPLSTPTAPAEAAPASPSTPPVSDVLTLEQIRDMVAPTRGFFSRDYSLGLGWNNVSICAVPLLNSNSSFLSLIDAVYH